MRTAHRRGPLVLAALVAIGATASCVSAPSRATPGTTAFAPASLCDPIRSLSVTAWTEDGPRSQVASDLTAARDHAPQGLHAVLDTLLELERAGIHPPLDGRASSSGTTPVGTAAAGTGPGGTDAAGLDRWFDAMSTLSDIAERECDVDVAAGAAAGGPSASLPAPTAVPSGATPGTGLTLTPRTVLDLVRAGRPDSRLVDAAMIGSVSSADVVQVAVVDVDDLKEATAICEDLLAVLPVRTYPPTVTVRNRTGFVTVAGDDGRCEIVPHP